VRPVDQQLPERGFVIEYLALNADFHGWIFFPVLRGSVILNPHHLHHNCVSFSGYIGGA